MTLDRPLADLQPGITITGYTEHGRRYGVIVGGGAEELARYRGRGRHLARAQADLLACLGPGATLCDALRALRPF